MTHAPEVLLTDGKIIEGEIFVTNLVAAHLTLRRNICKHLTIFDSEANLHAFSVITFIPEGDVTLCDDLFAHKASKIENEMKQLAIRL